MGTYCRDRANRVDCDDHHTGERTARVVGHRGNSEALANVVKSHVLGKKGSRVA